MELRQRRPEWADKEEPSEDSTGGNDDRFVFRLPSASSEFPSPDEIVEQHPDCKHGPLEKRNNSVMMHLAPCCTRKWKCRYFCLVGGYLYRFSAYPGGSVKGVPIPLDACSIRVLEEGDISLEPGEEIHSCFEMSMIRKRYVFKATSKAEAGEWVAALRARKLQSIKESLGHAPISSAVRALNTKAAKKFSMRIDLDRTEGEARIRELQAGGGGQVYNPLLGGMGMKAF